MEIYKYFDNQLSEELRIYIESQLDTMKKQLDVMLDHQTNLHNNLKKVSQLKIINYPLYDLNNKLKILELQVEEKNYLINSYTKMLVEKQINEWADIKGEKYINSSLKSYEEDVHKINNILCNLY
jgi:hypothetical protein